MPIRPALDRRYSDEEWRLFLAVMEDSGEPAPQPKPLGAAAPKAGHALVFVGLAAGLIVFSELFRAL